MNTISFILKYLGPIVLIVTLFYDYSLQYISTNKFADKHRKLSKTKYILVGIAGLLGLGANAIADYNQAKNDIANRTDRTNLLNRIEMQGTAFTNEMRSYAETTKKETEAAKKEAEATQIKYDKLLLKIAAKSPTDPALLAALTAENQLFELAPCNNGDITQAVLVLRRKRDLAELKAIEAHLKSVQVEKEFINPYLPVWNYTMSRLQLKLGDLDKQICQGFQAPLYKELPDVCLTPPDGSDVPSIKIPVLAITSRTNAGWQCECRIERYPNMIAHSSGWQPRLMIECRGKNGTAAMYVSRTLIQFSIPGLVLKDIAISNDMTVIDKALDELMVSVADQLGVADK